MSQPITQVFQFLDGPDHDATVDETSATIENCQNYVWNVTPTCVAIGGTAQYTVEVSNDGVCWFDYATVFTNVSTVDAVEDIQLSFTKMRINHKSGTATMGTVKYTLTQKARS